MKPLFAMMLLSVCVQISAAREINVSDGISFEVPDAFTEFSKDEIALKYPSVNAPRFVVGNVGDGRSVSIAYDLKESGMPPEKMVDDELPNALKGFVGTFNRMIPGIKWIKKDLVKMAGRRWIHLELTSSAIDQDIHNIILITFHEQKLLIFNFNSTKAHFPAFEKELRRCAGSIKFSPASGK